MGKRRACCHISGCHLYEQKWAILIKAEMKWFLIGSLVLSALLYYYSSALSVQLWQVTGGYDSHGALEH